MAWIHLAQDRNKWRAFVNMATNLRVPLECREFLSHGLVACQGGRCCVVSCRRLLSACMPEQVMLLTSGGSAKGPHCAGWGPEAVPPPLEICACESEKSVAVRQSSQLAAAGRAQDRLCVAPSGRRLLAATAILTL